MGCVDGSDRIDDKTANSGRCSLNFVLVLYRKMSIITLSEALLQKLPQKDGLILRDWILCVLCIRIGRRSRTFLIATSVGGKQLRMTLRWPLISVEEARVLAAPILKNCRNGQTLPLGIKFLFFLVVVHDSVNEAISVDLVC